MSVLTLPNLVWLGIRSTYIDIRYTVRWYTLALLLVFSLALISSIIIIEITWHDTQYSMSETTIAGTRTYRHDSDERTTTIVNYHTGRGELPESERLPLYRQYVKNMLERAKMDIPQDFHTRDWNGVNELAILWYKQQFPNYPRDRKALQRVINGLFENAIRPPLEKFTPNVYDNLWHLLGAVGSPKIRWVEEQDEPASRLVVYSAGDTKQSFYDPVENTIYIAYADSIGNLLDEVGHAKQFREKPLRSYTRLSWSMILSWVGSGGDMKMAKEIYKIRYQHENTFEGEAHGPIKEKLLRESGLLIVEEETIPKT